MGLDIRPGLVHARADEVAEAGRLVDLLRDDPAPLRPGATGFETDALLARVAERLEQNWADLARDTRGLAEAMHESATAVERNEETLVELAEHFFRQAGRQ